MSTKKTTEKTAQGKAKRATPKAQRADVKAFRARLLEEQQKRFDAEDAAWVAQNKARDELIRKLLPEFELAMKPEFEFTTTQWPMWTPGFHLAPPVSPGDGWRLVSVVRSETTAVGYWSRIVGRDSAFDRALTLAKEALGGSLGGPNDGAEVVEFVRGDSIST